MENHIYGNLKVSIHPSRKAMGEDAASLTADLIRSIAKEKGVVSMVFAAAPSQNEFLEALLAIPGIPWELVVAMHMDEYIGLPKDSTQRFSVFLDDRIFSKVKFKQVHRLNSSTADPGAECKRYARILESNKVDIVCMGVGENGHIAFNDPPVADFNDPELVKVVLLERSCREQQVHDGCFVNLEAVPTHAMTLTIPALFGAAHLVCVVPGPLKAQAVRAMLRGEISTACPASILRKHPNARLFLDGASAALIG